MPVLRRWWFAFGVAACLAHLVVASFQLENSSDTPWHLALGEELLDTGRIPRVDRYSQTWVGRPYHVVLWLSQAVFAASYRLTGSLVGPMVVRLVCVVGAFLGVLALARARGVRAAIALPVVAVAFELARPRFQLRAEVFLPPFLVALLWLLHLHERRRSTVALLATVPLVALFANFHPGLPSLLLAVLFAYVGAQVAAALGPPALQPLLGPRASSRAALLCVGVAGAAVAAWAVNPTGFEVVRFLLSVPGDRSTADIVEYAPLRFTDQRLLFQAFVLVALPAIVAGWHPHALAGAAATIGLALPALRYPRMVTAFVIVGAAVVPVGIEHAVARLAHRLPVGRRRAWGVAGMVGLLSLMGLGASEAYLRDLIHRRVGARFDPAVYPVAAAEFLAANPTRGRMFNDYGFGGYLLWRLGPSQPVFIDGRTPMLYDEAHYTSCVEALEDPRSFLALASRYGHTRAVLRSRHAATFSPSALGWMPVWFDRTAVVYAADSPSERGVRERFGYRHLDPMRPLLPLLLVGDPALGEATAEADRAVAADPTNPAARLLRATLAAAAGDEASLSATVAALDPREARVDEGLLRAALLLGQRKAVAALAHLDALRSAGQDAPLHRMLRALALEAAGRTAEARALLGALAGYPEAELRLGEIAAASGDAVEARRWRERFLAAVGADTVYAARAARVRALTAR